MLVSLTKMHVQVNISVTGLTGEVSSAVRISELQKILKLLSKKAYSFVLFEKW